MNPAKLMAQCVRCIQTYNPLIDTVDVHVMKFLGPDPSKVGQLLSCHSARNARSRQCIDSLVPHCPA